METIHVGARARRVGLTHAQILVSKVTHVQRSSTSERLWIQLALRVATYNFLCCLLILKLYRCKVLGIISLTLCTLP